MRLKNKKVLVYGLGDSGRAVINLLKEKKAQVSFYDDNVKFYEYIGFERHPQDKNYDFVIISPGIKCRGNKLLEVFSKKNIPVIAEIDFAYLLSKGKIIAITGTNGKTTVSMLTAKILKTAGYKTFLCGNIGLPFSAVCEKTNKHSIIVCEVSNFQLETSRFFKANVACVLNIKPDHLDRHGSFEEYKNVKAKIAQNLKNKDVLILNFDDVEAKKLILHKKIDFFSKKMLKKGIFIKNNQIYINKKSVLSLNEINLKGEKNLENVLASVAICSHFKVKKEDYSRAVSSFTLASHRMQEIGQIKGVTYVDDSKATNVASTYACLESYKNENVFLLMGGRGKDIEYDDIFDNDFKIKQVVCFGEERDKIFACAQKFGYDAVKFNFLRQAVDYVKTVAEDGDYCLLSPACASFDEFESYQDRGEKFKQFVLEQKYEVDFKA